MNQQEKNGGEGRLTSMAPLANPYVPFQMENPPRYEPRKGLIRGTLFTGLDLPFMGMVNKNELPVTPLSELQAFGFAIQELALYLDTHKNDREAFELYTAMQRMYTEAKETYEKGCGPLTHYSATNQVEYKWIDDPWPWEYAKNREA